MLREEPFLLNIKSKIIFFIKVMCNFRFLNQNVDLMIKSLHFSVSKETIHKIIIKLLIDLLDEKILLSHEYFSEIMSNYENYSWSIEYFFNKIYSRIIQTGKSTNIYSKSNHKKYQKQKKFVIYFKFYLQKFLEIVELFKDNSRFFKSPQKFVSEHYSQKFKKINYYLQRIDFVGVSKNGLVYSKQKILSKIKNFKLLLKFSKMTDAPQHKQKSYTSILADLGFHLVFQKKGAFSQISSSNSKFYEYSQYDYYKNNKKVDWGVERTISREVFKENFKKYFYVHTQTKNSTYIFMDPESAEKYIDENNDDLIHVFYV